MPNTVVCIGDSLTNGRDWTNNSSPLMNLNVRLSMKYPRIGFVNLGVNGDTTADIISRKTDVNIYNPFRVILWAGVNDINASTPAVTIEANLQSLYTYYAGLGYEIYALNIPPNDNNDVTQNGIRTTVNAWISSSATGLTRIIDTWTIIRDPSNIAIRLPAYAETRATAGSHINDAGYTALLNGFP